MFTTHKLQGAGGTGGGNAYYLAEVDISSGLVLVKSVDVNASGDIVFCGDRSSTDVVGIVDAGGKLLMNKSFSNTTQSPSSCLDAKWTSAGNIVGLFRAGFNDLLIEFQTDGTVNWDAFTTTSRTYQNRCLSINSSGDIYTYGSSWASPYGPSDYKPLLHKYNSSGVRQYTYQHSTGYYQFLNYAQIGIDSSNYLYFTTDFYDLGAAEWGFAYIRKVNSNLGTAGGWVRTRGQASSAKYTFTHAVTVDSSDYVIAVGETPDPTYKSPYVIQFNSSGTEQWQRKLTHSLGDNIPAISVTTDASRNIYVGCTSGYLFKYNSSGALQWQRRITLSGVGQPINRLAFDDTNDALIVAADAYIAKLYPDGSGTGTYGNFVYSAPTSFTSNTATLSQPYTGGSLSVASMTDTATTSSSVDQTITLTKSNI